MRALPLLVVAAVVVTGSRARADAPPVDADACAAQTSALTSTASAVDVLAAARCQRALKHHAQAAALYDRYLADAPTSDASAAPDATQGRALVDSEAAEERALAATATSGKVLGADPSPGNPFAKTVSREAKPGPAPLWQSPIFWGIAAGVAAAVLVSASIVVVVVTTPNGGAAHG
ncbi:MAG TPA: hypothetical protein VGO62_18340 [Myxococcota bacterium]|jgi:hypothetical protein